MTIQTRVRKDEMGHLVAYAYDDDPKPLTRDQLAALTKAIGGRVDELVDEYEAERVRELESLRESRLTREAYQDLTNEERQQFDRENNPISLLRAVAEQAQQEADSEWQAAEQQRQFDAWIEWRKKHNPKVEGRAETELTYKLDAEGKERESSRLAQRAKRQLEAEAEPDEARRLVASLGTDEQAVFIRLLEQQPTRLEQIERWKAEHRNPIADIDDAGTLYRLANNPPKRDKPYIPPTSEIANVESSRTLYQMHERDVAAKSKQKVR